MGLKDELGLPNPIATLAHEAMLNIFVTAEALGKEADRVLLPYGLTKAQFDILMLLEHQAPDGGADQSTLGRMLVVNRSNVTGLIDRMERDGLVKRAADPADRRVKRVRMTPRGLKALRAAEQAYVVRTREVVAALPVAEQEALCRSLERVRASLRKTAARKRA